MKLVTFILAIFFAQLGVSQKDIRPTIGASYTNETKTDFFTFTDYALRNKVNIYAGVRFADYFCVNIGIGTALGPIPENKKLKQIQALTNSLSLSYRILKTKHVLSPMLVTNFGYELMSNAKGEFITKHPYMVQTIGESNFVSYDRMVYFGNVALMLDAEYKNMSLRAGICFNYSRFSYYDVNDYFYSNFYYKSFGIEAGMMYTFPMKKRQAKKNGVGE